MESIRFGIVGCGVIAPWHARAISNTPEARLVACCDVIESKARKLALDFGAERVYTDYRQMLESGTIDAVCVCVPSGLHGDVTIAAAQSGIHVMCEKPIDITLQHIDEMTKACANAGVKLGGIFQRRTSPLWRKIKNTVSSGHLGKMVGGDAYLKYHRSQSYYDSADWRGTWQLDGGGALMNQGIHMIDLLLWVMGPVETVYAMTDHRVRSIEVEDTAYAVLKFESGAFGAIEGMTSVYPGMDHRMEFHGEYGTIQVTRESITAWDIRGEDNAVSAENGLGGVDVKLGTAETEPTDAATQGHQLLIQDICRAIIEDRNPMVTPEESRKSVELILAIYESSKKGIPIQLVHGKRQEALV